MGIQYCCFHHVLLLRAKPLSEETGQKVLHRRKPYTRSKYCSFDLELFCSDWQQFSSYPIHWTQTGQGIQFFCLQTLSPIELSFLLLRTRPLKKQENSFVICRKSFSHQLVWYWASWNIWRLILEPMIYFQTHHVEHGVWRKSLVCILI